MADYEEFRRKLQGNTQAQEEAVLQYGPDLPPDMPGSFGQAIAKGDAERALQDARDQEAALAGDGPAYVRNRDPVLLDLQNPEEGYTEAEKLLIERYGPAAVSKAVPRLNMDPVTPESVLMDQVTATEAPWYKRLERGATASMGHTVDWVAEKFGGDIGTAREIEAAASAGTNVPYPETLHERMLDMGGRVGADSALAAPVVAAVPPVGVSRPAAVGLDLAAGVAGGYGGQWVQEKTGSPMAGLLAMALPAIAGPGATVGAVRKGKTIVRNLPGGEMSRATRDLQKWGKAHGLQMSSRGYYDAAQLVQSASPDAARGADQMDALAQINRQLGKDAPGGRIQPRQAFDSMPYRWGGGWVDHLDEGISSSDPQYAARVARESSIVQEYVDKRLVALGHASAEDGELLKHIERGASRLQLDERDAWTAFERMNGKAAEINVQSVQKAVQELVENPQWTTMRQAIPTEFRDILGKTEAGKRFLLPNGNLNPNMSIQDFQDFRSALLRYVREAKATGTAKSNARLKLIMPVIDAAQSQMDDWLNFADDASGLTGEVDELWRFARALTRQNADLMNASTSPVIRALENGGDWRTIINAAHRRSGGTLTNLGELDAHRLVRLADQSEGGRDALRRVTIDTVLSRSVNADGEILPASIIKEMHRHKDSYEILMGRRHYADVEMLLELRRAAMLGKAGSKIQATSVGSGRGPIEPNMRILENILAPVHGTFGANIVAKLMRNAFPDMATRSYMAERVIYEAMQNEELMALLLRANVQPGSPGYVLRWQEILKTLSRGGVRGSRVEATRQKNQKTQQGFMD